MSGSYTGFGGWMSGLACHASRSGASWREYTSGLGRVVNSAGSATAEYKSWIA
jgi:hypothetical protein